MKVPFPFFSPQIDKLWEKTASCEEKQPLAIGREGIQRLLKDLFLWEVEVVSGAEGPRSGLAADASTAPTVLRVLLKRSWGGHL